MEILVGKSFFIRTIWCSLPLFGVGTAFPNQSQPANIRVRLCWLTECLTGTFWLTDRDAGTKPLNRDCSGQNGTYGMPNCVPVLLVDTASANM